jgi:beta-lactamase regulating signal transducer with metallopeptidase domain
MRTLIETALSNALVACLLALLAFAVSRWRRPALAHGLWLLVLLKLLTPPLIPIYLPGLDAEPAKADVPTSTAVVESNPVQPAATEELGLMLEALVLPPPAANEPAQEETKPEQEPTNRWLKWLIPVWLGGSVLWLAATLYSIWRFQRVLRWARPAPLSIQDHTRRLAAKFGIQRPPRVYVVEGVVTPMIWAVGGAPRLLFPAGLLDRLDAEQRAALLLHELAHVRRRDHWVRFLELLVVALYWWHPVVWWARRELREAEEQCCDAWVVWASSGEGQTYARALLEAVAFVSHTRSPLPAAASGIGHVSHLKRRLTMIMQGNTPRSLSALGWIIVLGVGLCLLPLAAQAQQPFQKSEDDKDQEIKSLRLKLRAAEEQERALGKKAKSDRGDQQPSRDQLLQSAAELKRLIGEKQAELHALQAKLQQTLSLLGDGKEGKSKLKVKDMELKELRNKEALANYVEELKKLQDAGALEQSLDKLKDLMKLKGLEMKQLAEQEQLKALKALKAAEFARAKAEREAQKAKKDANDGKMKIQRNEDVEMRLERILKEVEQLRREIRKEKGLNEKGPRQE